jgi:subtilisin family serine protease
MSVHRSIVEVDVFDHDGQRIVDATVTLTSVEGGDEQELAVDAFGVSYIAVVEPGRYILAARARNCADDQRAIEIDDGGLQTVMVLGHPGMPFYYRGDVKVRFTRRDDLLAVAFDPTSADQAAGCLDRIARKRRLSEIPVDVNVQRQNIRVLQFESGVTPFDRSAAIEELVGIEGIGAVGPLVRWQGGRTGLAILTDEYVVRFHPHLENAAIADIVRHFGLQVLRQLVQAPNTYLLRVPGIPRYETLEIAQELVATGHVAYAEPNLICADSQNDAADPSDLLFPMQWHLPLIGCPRAWQSIRESRGREHAMGSPDITIAVVDWGIDIGNPDLCGTVSNGKSKIYKVFDFQEMVADNRRRAHGHGTCCAGVATALSGNDGVCGVAGNCRLMAIRRPEGEAASEIAYADMYLWIAGLDPKSDRKGFPGPVGPGADVISNSFGHAVGAPISGLMRDTFHHLVAAGRDGRGTLLFFSAGNHKPPQDFTLARPWAACKFTIAVTASSLASDAVEEIGARESNFSGGSARIDLCAPSASWLGASYDPPNSQAIVTTADHSFIDPDFNLQPNAPSRLIARTTTIEPTAAQATALAVASTERFHLDEFVLVGTLGASDAEFSQVTGIPIGGLQLEVQALQKPHPSQTQVIGGPSWSTRGFSGTSCATAMVAGVGALLLSANPNLTWAEVRDILRDTAIPIDIHNENPSGVWHDVEGIAFNTPGYSGPHYSRWYGFGRIDAAAATARALDYEGCAQGYGSSSNDQHYSSRVVSCDLSIRSPGPDRIQSGNSVSSRTRRRPTGLALTSQERRTVAFAWPVPLRLRSRLEYLADARQVFAAPEEVAIFE